jgi:hypothetical protein
MRDLSPFALAPRPPNAHIEGMQEPHTKFETIQLKHDARWRVRITLPHGAQSHISNFKTEAEARTWIGENSGAWLMRLVSL